MKGLIIDHGSTLIDALKELFPEADVMHHSTFDRSIAESHDFIVLSGGPIHISHPEDLLEEKEFLKTTKKPVLGICLGLEILGVTFGSRLLKLKKKRKGLYALDILGENGMMYYKHGWFIKDAPEGFDVLARDDDIITAMACKDRPILAVQGHPEKSGDFGNSVKRTFIENFVK